MDREVRWYQILTVISFTLLLNKILSIVQYLIEYMVTGGQLIQGVC